MKWEDGKIIEFVGCTWDAGWEFDAPLIIYSPIERFFDVHSICEASIEAKVGDILIDLCINGEIRDKFGEEDLKEFAWRGWSVQGFRQRKNAIHHKVTARLLYDEHRQTSFIVSSKERR